MTVLHRDAKHQRTSHYFDDKADLYRHLVLNELAARRSAVLVPAAATGTFFERLLTRAISDQTRARGAAFFREQLKTAVQRGEVRADIDLDIAARLVATLAGPGIVDALSFKLEPDPT